MTETLAQLSNEYQHGRVQMVIKNLGILVLWTKVALAWEGVTQSWLEIRHRLEFNVCLEVYHTNLIKTDSFFQVLCYGPCTNYTS